MIRTGESISYYQNLLAQGHNPYIDVTKCDKVLLHLVEEIGELVQANNKRSVTIPKEAGDVLILLMFYCISKDINLEDVFVDKINENIMEGKFIPKE